MSLPNPKELTRLRENAVLFAQKLADASADREDAARLFEERRAEDRRRAEERVAELTAALKAVTARLEAEIARETAQLEALSAEAPEKKKPARKR